jgi:hypothetical protein
LRKKKRERSRSFFRFVEIRPIRYYASAGLFARQSLLACLQLLKKFRRRSAPKRRLIIQIYLSPHLCLRRFQNRFQGLLKIFFTILLSHSSGAEYRTCAFDCFFHYMHPVVRCPVIINFIEERYQFPDQQCFPQTNPNLSRFPFHLSSVSLIFLKRSLGDAGFIMNSNPSLSIMSLSILSAV